MLDLTIDHLELNIENAAGQEHRFRPITTQAVTILAYRLGECWTAEGRMLDLKNLESLYVSPMSHDLQHTSNKQAADAIAQAILREFS